MRHLLFRGISARIARNTQLFLEEETGVTRLIDPLGGSFYVEYLTSSLAEKAWTIIEEIEAQGGMTKAIESGLPKLHISKRRRLPNRLASSLVVM